MRRQLNSLLQQAQVLRARLLGRLLREEIEAPVFLIGCGRSGKTTLGAALALHPLLTFLDESRPLWIAFFPQADLWTAHAAARGGRLHLQKEDADAQAARRLRVLMQHEMKKRGGQRLLQSLAANSFRVDFLRAVFPDAKFIHVVRNGLHIAAEIAQRAERQGWYGKNGYKWEQLAEYATHSPLTASLPNLCENNFQRGLLEWRLCVDAVRSAHLPQQALLEIRYEELLAQPREYLRRSAAFLGLPIDATWETRALACMHAPSPAPAYTPNETDVRIGGAFLQEWAA